jgi:hypothetical protein
MWEPRRHTTIWAFTACYRDSFTFFFTMETCVGVEVYSPMHPLTLDGCEWSALRAIRFTPRKRYLGIHSIGD